LPDIDATSAKIHYIGGGVLGGAKGTFHHRGFFHSFLAAALIFIVSLVFLFNYYPLLPFVLALGYVSHPIIDGLSRGGVQYLFPYKKKFYLLPKSLAIKTDGQVDQAIFFIGVMTLILFILAVYYPQLNDFSVLVNQP